MDVINGWCEPAEPEVPAGPWPQVLHDQLEEILGEVWRQEAWAETEELIDLRCKLAGQGDR